MIIQWLSDWLREIILVILLATFVDLLLPNSTMQRYVKVVISLFILLTILSPVISLLKSETELEMMMSTGVNQQSLSLYDGQIDSLQEITGEGEKLSALNTEQSLQLIETQMEEMILDQLATEMPDHMLTVNVETEVKEGEPSPEVKNIQVSLMLTTEKSKETKPPSDSFTPIAPVSIQVEVGQETENKDKLNREKNEHIERIKEQVFGIIVDNWKISSDKITFEYYKETTD